MIMLEVRDRDGNILAKGTSRECANALGLSEPQFRGLVVRVRDGRNKRYQIKEIGKTGRHDNRDRLDDSEIRQAIEAWDRFVEPIRKRFGIPVYQGKDK